MLRKRRNPGYLLATDCVCVYIYIYIYKDIDTPEKTPTFHTFRHKPSSVIITVIITDEGLCRNLLKVFS